MSDQIACTKEWKEMPLQSLDRNNLSSPSPFAAPERRRQPNVNSSAKAVASSSGETFLSLRDSRPIRRRLVPLNLAREAKTRATLR